jgi:hypothetical protein
MSRFTGSSFGSSRDLVHPLGSARCTVIVAVALVHRADLRVLERGQLGQDAASVV